MKKKTLNLIAAVLMLIGVAAPLAQATAVSNTQVVEASRRARYSRSKDRTKVWTSSYEIVGNRRSRIFHVRKRGRSYRMNRGNVVIFKSIAAAKAAGYRESKR